MIGNLVGTLGIAQQTAAVIATVISTSGPYAAVAIWPFLAPFIGTIKGVTAVIGLAGLIGW